MASWGHLARTVREPEQPESLSHCPPTPEQLWQMTKKAQLPCFAPHHTLPFRVCSWGAPPQTGAFLCPLPKDPLNLGVWDYKELGSLNILPLCLTQPLLSVPRTPPLPSLRNLTRSGSRCRSVYAASLPRARNWYKQENWNLSVSLLSPTEGHNHALDMGPSS